MSAAPAGAGFGDRAGRSAGHSVSAVNESTARLTALLTGLGVAQTYAFMAQPHIESGALVELLAGREPPPMPVWVAYPSSRHLSAKLRAFVDWTVEVFAPYGSDRRRTEFASCSGGLVHARHNAPMCSHYQAEKRRKQIEKHFGIRLPPEWEPPPGGLHIYPTQMAPFIRRPPERESGDEAVPDFELVEGHFGLLPGFAKEVRYGLNTYNARSETVRELASFKNAWAKPRHCIVPCEAIYEPDWRSGQFVPTRFAAANDETLGVAGLWSPWKNPESGAWELSFTMLTINADDHPLFNQMHRPDPKRPPEQQDKRMVVILPEAQYGEWLDATPQRSMEFMMQFPADRLAMTAEPLPPKEPKAKAARASKAPPEEPSLF